MRIQKHKGFTLIELLVVIAIIALLASIVLIALSGARSKARDSTRRADMRQLATALELYYNDNGAYPNTNNNWWGNCPSFGGYPSSGSGAWIPGLAPSYVGALPTDPLGTSKCFLYRSTGTDYFVMAFQDVENCANESSDTMRRPAQPTECDYAEYTAGAAGW
jgi:general secretion pathway protein G